MPYAVLNRSLTNRISVPPIQFVPPTYSIFSLYMLLSCTLYLCTLFCFWVAWNFIIIIILFPFFLRKQVCCYSTTSLALGVSEALIKKKVCFESLIFFFNSERACWNMQILYVVSIKKQNRGVKWINWEKKNICVLSLILCREFCENIWNLAEMVVK